MYDVPCGANLPFKLHPSIWLSHSLLLFFVCNLVRLHPMETKFHCLAFILNIVLESKTSNCSAHRLVHTTLVVGTHSLSINPEFLTGLCTFLTYHAPKPLLITHSNQQIFPRTKTPIVAEALWKSLVAFLLGRTEQGCDLLVIQIISIL
jgi:hypothetical protein